MHRAPAAWLIALIATTASCSLTGFTSAEDAPPEWADGTDWSGTVTMKSGTVLTAKFHLERMFVKSTFYGANVWELNVKASLENTLTATSANAIAEGFGGPSHVRKEYVSIRVRQQEGDAIVDRNAPACSGADAHMEYVLSTDLANDGSLRGDLQLLCWPQITAGFAQAAFLDARPIVMQRVPAR